ncbi:hypothetical protein [Dyadobacter luticola]|uniref:Glycosyltransferase family 2 protein n=1 Tax=Dyadobacter luticola TaxID=1979387 RepID=A0A5R9L3V6_9BACT|nr:hypothetical protein [Dyadobacter luticola]TLV03233.1 hypothetical protein FEN17_06375 [Dyadobacter luticola]
MNTKAFDIPVLLITFNRPETTCHVFEQIRKIKPAKLYIFSDAPRAEKPDEAELVETCRVMMDDSQINWDCEVERWFSEVNMGKAVGISSAITWAFETTEQLIILEDDCLPHPTFFTFCKFMLEKYQSNDRIMHVSGTHWDKKFKTEQADHFFSRIGHIWGWATWKRAWNKYDFWMERFPEMLHQRKIQKIFGDASIADYWNERFNKVYQEEKKESWDYQWQYTLFQNYGLAAVPNVNLISNIGLRPNQEAGEQQEYQFYETKVWRNMKTDVKLTIDDAYERFRAKSIFIKNLPVGSRILHRVRSLINSIL